MPAKKASEKRPREDEEDMEEEDEGHGEHFPKLPGSFIQYPPSDTDPHPGIGIKKEIRRNAIALLSQARRSAYHRVTASLIFLCLIIPGLYDAFRFGGVREESFLDTPVERDGVRRVKTAKFYGSQDVDRELTQLEVSSILSHCCSLLIGVVIGASEKIRSEAIQIKKRFKTLMVSLKKPAHGDTANLLQTFNPADAIDWINSQSWVGSLVFGLLTTDFESPGKEFMEQLKLVASYAQMTTYTTIKEYLEQCMDATLTIPAVAKEISDFLTVVARLKKKHGEMFKYLGATRHPDAIQLAPRSFPNLASAALYWSRKENPSMTGYKAPVIQQGASVKEAQLTRLRHREVLRGDEGDDLDDDIMAVMASIGVTGLKPR
ncbi:TPA_asm: nucleoprotein [Caribbean watersnake bornavirus]|uniref:Nucleoprotein n=1 Tax=Caribbean watersnake bornavirus TaxID=2817570 RepID=A0A8D9PHA7_9MONO|nr:TPA_asm: nucleoprotein [Caribbean watersnake bornavirus]